MKRALPRRPAEPRTLPDSHLAPTYSCLTPALLLPHSHLSSTSLTSALPHLPPPSSFASSSPHLPPHLTSPPSSLPHLPPHLTYLLLISLTHLPSPTSLRTRWATLCSAELEWISQLEIAQLEISQLEIAQLEGPEGAAAGLGAGSS